MPLEYLLQEPVSVQEKNPLILLIHGYGSNEEDLFSFAPELPQSCYVISVRAPHQLMYGSYAWYAINFDANDQKFSDIPQALDSRDLLMEFISDIVAQYPIDQNQIHLIGFSQGAILSLALGLSYPEKFSKIVALSGYLNTEMATPGFEKNNFSQLKMFVSHGTVDQVIPVEWSRKSVPILQNLGIDCVFKEYPVGHGVSPQNFYDFKNWLEM